MYLLCYVELPTALNFFVDSVRCTSTVPFWPVLVTITWNFFINLFSIILAIVIINRDFVQSVLVILCPVKVAVWIELSHCVTGLGNYCKQTDFPSSKLRIMHNNTIF